MTMVEITSRGETLADIWRRAEKLGRVRVDEDGWGSGVYKVEIKFKRRGSESTVWATGKSPVIEQALSLAIREALELGAEQSR